MSSTTRPSPRFGASRKTAGCKLGLGRLASSRSSSRYCSWWCFSPSWRHTTAPQTGYIHAPYCRKDLSRTSRHGAGVGRCDSPGLLTTHGKTGTSERRIVLTFDHGPRPEGNFLRTRAPRQGETRPGATDRKGRHTIGNHTFNHADMSDLSQKRMRLELRRTRAAVDDALGYPYPMVLMDRLTGILISTARTRCRCSGGSGPLPHTVDTRHERLHARWRAAGHRTRVGDRAKRGKGPGAALARHPQANCERIAADHRPLREIRPAIRDRGRVAC
jgi:peptidoglycan/xylan/chitin deacetylase (PgdA/CDA1 family)